MVGYTRSERGGAPVAEVVDPWQMVRVADRRSRKRPMARPAHRPRPQNGHCQTTSMGLDLLRHRRVRDRHRTIAERIARVAIGCDRFDAVADEAGDPRVGEGIVGSDVAVDVARGQKQRVMAAGAEAARARAPMLAELVDARPVPWVVEGGVCVRAVHPLRGDVGVTGRAIVGLGEASDVQGGRCRYQGRARHPLRAVEGHGTLGAAHQEPTASPQPDPARSAHAEIDALDRLSI